MKERVLPLFRLCSTKNSRRKLANIEKCLRVLNLNKIKFYWYQTLQYKILLFFSIMEIEYIWIRKYNSKNFIYIFHVFFSGSFQFININKSEILKV